MIFDATALHKSLYSNSCWEISSFHTIEKAEILEMIYWLSGTPEHSLLNYWTIQIKNCKKNLCKLFAVPCFSFSLLYTSSSFSICRTILAKWFSASAFEKYMVSMPCMHALLPALCMNIMCSKLLFANININIKYTNKSKNNTNRKTTTLHNKLMRSHQEERTSHIVYMWNLPFFLL